MPYKKSKKTCRTEELLAKRTQLLKSQWVRCVSLKMIRPQTLSGSQTRMAQGYLIEFADNKAVGPSICLAEDFDAAFNGYMKMSYNQCLASLNAEYQKHDPNQEIKVWRPIAVEKPRLKYFYTPAEEKTSRCAINTDHIIDQRLRSKTAIIGDPVLNASSSSEGNDNH